MNGRDLRKLLDAEGFNPQVDSLDGGDGWDIECMSPDSGGWSVCHRERGSRDSMSWFPTEDEACEEILRRLRKGELRWSHLPVNMGLLKRMLDEERFCPEVYSLDGGLEDGRHCLSADGDRWSVYHVIEGQRVDERRFESEGDACGELLRRLRALPRPESRRQTRFPRLQPADKRELRQILDEEKFQPTLYSLDGEIEGRYCLTAEGNRWCVHCMIEGERIHERWFESEGDACADVLWRLRLPLRLKGLPGDRRELKRVIDEERFYPTVYNLDGDMEGRICLSAEGGKWRLYCVKDGRRTEERWFGSEKAACAETLWRLRELLHKVPPVWAFRIDPERAKDWRRWGRDLPVFPPMRQIAGARDVYPGVEELIAELELAGSSQPAAILQYRMRHVPWGAGPEHFGELRLDLSRALGSQGADLPESIKARMRRIVEVIDADTEEAQAALKPPQ
jgi:hypothetical protein